MKIKEKFQQQKQHSLGCLVEHSVANFWQSTIWVQRAIAAAWAAGGGCILANIRQKWNKCFSKRGSRPASTAGTCSVPVPVPIIEILFRRSWVVMSSRSFCSIFPSSQFLKLKVLSTERVGPRLLLVTEITPVEFWRLTFSGIPEVDCTKWKMKIIAQIQNISTKSWVQTLKNDVRLQLMYTDSLVCGRLNMHILYTHTHTHIYAFVDMRLRNKTGKLTQIIGT